MVSNVLNSIREYCTDWLRSEYYNSELQNISLYCIDWIRSDSKVLHKVRKYCVVLIGSNVTAKYYIVRKYCIVLIGSDLTAGQ